MVSNNSVSTTGTWLVEGNCSKQFSVLIAGGLVNPIQGSELGCMPFRMLNLSSVNVTMCKDAEVALPQELKKAPWLLLVHSNVTSRYEQLEVPVHKKKFLHKLVDHCEEDLPKEKHEQLCMLLLAYVDIFADRDNELGCTLLDTIF